MGRGLLAAWEKMGEGVDNSHDGDLKSHSFSQRMLTGRKEDICFRERGNRICVNEQNMATKSQEQAAGTREPSQAEGVKENRQMQKKSNRDQKKKKVRSTHSSVPKRRRGRYVLF